jgi:hypothetical protein
MRRRYSTSAACQIAMSETLQSLRIPHAIMQFSTGGGGIKHYDMKFFNESFVSRDKLIKRYSSSHIYMGSNADGEGVTEAAQMLARRPESNKILIVLSDGQPAFGFGDDDRFLKDTVASIEDSKIMDILGIGIQTRAVRAYYKDCEVVDNLTDLEGVLVSLLRDKVLK